MVRRYAALANSAATKLERVKLGRVLAGALNRRGIPTVTPERDRMLVQEMLRNRADLIYTRKMRFGRSWKLRTTIHLPKLLYDL